MKLSVYAVGRVIYLNVDVQGSRTYPINNNKKIGCHIIKSFFLLHNWLEVFRSAYMPASIVTMSRNERPIIILSFQCRKKAQSTLSRIPCSVFIVSTLHSDFVLSILFMMERSTWRSPLQSIRSTISCVYVISIEK